jgi:hypothetical protein
MTVDDTPLKAMEGELESLLASLSPHAIKHVSDILDVFAEKTGELFIFEGDGLAAFGAAEDTVFLKPSALFKELMSALRIRAAQLDVCV